MKQIRHMLKQRNSVRALLMATKKLHILIHRKSLLTPMKQITHIFIHIKMRGINSLRVKTNQSIENYIKD